MANESNNWFKELFIDEAKAALDSRAGGGELLIDAEEVYY